MILTDEQKSAIESEYNLWKDCQYSGKTKNERQKMSQFFTPPALTIKMLEKFDGVKDKNVLDPACGAGGLLAACVLAGADPKRIYGIELDPEIRKVCVRRLAKLGVPPKHVKLGNALDAAVYDDFENYEGSDEDPTENFVEPPPETESEKKKKPAEKKPAEENPEKKPVVRETERDRNAFVLKLRKIYADVEVDVVELEFPDVETKTTTFGIASKGKIKKPVMVKLANFVKKLTDGGSWLLKDFDFDDVKKKYALNDVSFDVDDGRLLNAKIAEIVSASDRREAGCFGDFGRFSAKTR